MAELILLNRIRGDIGEYSGSLSKLLSLASLNGFNDNYEPQEKPRLVGTWTINDWYTQEQLVQAQAAFDGLTIVGDSNWLITFDNLAVQVLDNTKPNYNPAVAVLMHGAGFGRVFNEPAVSGQEGRWFLTKTDAAAIKTFDCFAYQTDVVDTECIVSKNADTYSFEYFPEFEYFTGITSTGTGGGAGTQNVFYNSAKLKYIKTPQQLSTFGYSTFTGVPDSCVVDVLNLTTTRLMLAGTSADFRVRSNSDFTIGGSYNDPNNLSENTVIYVGTGDKYSDLRKLQRQLAFQKAGYAKAKIKTWYEYAAPQITLNGGLVTMSVERPSTIYYTTDGTTPTINSTEYTEPFNWDGVGAVKAMAIQTIDNVDDIVYAEDFYATTVSTPYFSYDDVTNRVTINSNTTGTTIYYTIDGTSPTTDSNVYIEPISIGNLGDIVNVRCFAVKDGMNSSDVTSKIFVIDDSLWGTNSDDCYFALQCIDSSKPNYNPAVCLVFANVNRLTFTSYGGGGGYMTKTDAAAITNDDRSQSPAYFNIETVPDNYKILGETSYNLSTFGEFKYFGINRLVSGGRGWFSSTFLTFIEIPEAVTTYGMYAITAPSGHSFTLKLDRETPTTDGVHKGAFINVDKIYVGDGSSASHDEAILADYLANSTWANWASRLDTWYNYLHPAA